MTMAYLAERSIAGPSVSAERHSVVFFLCHLHSSRKQIATSGAAGQVPLLLSCMLLTTKRRSTVPQCPKTSAVHGQPAVSRHVLSIAAVSSSRRSVCLFHAVAELDLAVRGRRRPVFQRRYPCCRRDSSCGHRGSHYAGGACYQ
jgi:hypothetical protein